MAQTEITSDQLLALGAQYRAAIKLYNGNGFNSYITLVDSTLSDLADQVHTVVLWFYADNKHTPNTVTINGWQILPDSSGNIQFNVLKEVLRGTQMGNQ